MNCQECSPIYNRREFLHRSGFGLGVLGLYGLLAEEGTASASVPIANQLTALGPRPTHFAPRAKHVIHIFLNGGPSHVDSFDPKPLLKRYEGRELPVPNLQTESPTGASFPSPFAFRSL